MIVLAICMRIGPQGLTQIASNFDDLKRAAVSAVKMLVILDKKTE
jgi:hypothetical protein